MATGEKGMATYSMMRKDRSVNRAMFSLAIRLELAYLAVNLTS